jgi:hypothetical protein
VAPSQRQERLEALEAPQYCPQGAACVAGAAAPPHGQTGGRTKDGWRVGLRFHWRGSPYPRTLKNVFEYDRRSRRSASTPNRRFTLSGLWLGGPPALRGV